MDWQEVAVKTDKEAVDAVSSILFDCGAGGVSVEDPEEVNRRIAENQWDAFSFDEEFLNRDYMTVKAYFSCDSTLKTRMGLVRERLDNLNRTVLPGTVRDVRITGVKDEDWANSWKAYYKPVKAGEKIVIKPSWEDYMEKPGELVIELDPGMAFGTGTHPTTTMCIKALEKLVKGGETVFDIGTGSGILAVAAAKLGAGKVIAIDIDEVAVEAARSNVEINGTGDIVTVLAGNLLDNVNGKADIVMANIIADVIICVCPDAAETVVPGGHFIASGIIAPRANEVIETIKKQGFLIKETVREGDWVSVLSVREV